MMAAPVTYTSVLYHVARTARSSQTLGEHGGGIGRETRTISAQPKQERDDGNSHNAHAPEVHQVLGCKGLSVAGRIGSQLVWYSVSIAGARRIADLLRRILG